MQTRWTLCFWDLLCCLYMMAYLHTYLSSPPSSPLSPYCDDFTWWWCHISNEGTCRDANKHHLNLNAALMILLYAKGNSCVDVGFFLFVCLCTFSGVAVSPELLVKFCWPVSYSFITLDQMRCYITMTDVFSFKWRTCGATLSWKWNAARTQPTEHW